ncbi:MAG: alpha/beta hydrolase [Patescibacteria group bacterium]|jgi:pimeloyl-ACP methyl ester carboxylesterase
MTNAILYNVFGILAVLAVIFFHIPTVWVVIGLVVIIILVIWNPLMPAVESIPKGFVEKKFDTGEVVLNYVEGPNNGPPILFIPGQAEFWQGYRLIIPSFVKKHHIFIVDVRGHGKSTKTPGKYSYNLCGEDLKRFLAGVIKQPTIVSGLSSGGVIALWLAANAPELVAVAIGEDPPIFSSIWPRIKDEKYMYRNFEVMVENLDKPDRDIEGYFADLGIPDPKGGDKLMLIPRPIAKFIAGGFKINKKLSPWRKYDIPMFPFNGRVGMKFLSEYDVDFSKATIDGRLSEGFDPETTLKKIQCPVLLIHANWSRHKTWGLLGAIDDQDVAKMHSLIKDFTSVDVKAQHEVHMTKPKDFAKIVDDYLESRTSRK